MFDIGFSELLLVAVVALVVHGHERLPKAARLAGLWVRRARAQGYSVKSDLEPAPPADEHKRSMDEARKAAAQLEQTMRETEAEVQAKARAAEEEARRGIEGLRRDLAGTPAPGTAGAPAADPADATAAGDASRQPGLPGIDDGHEGEEGQGRHRP